MLSEQLLKFLSPFVIFSVISSIDAKSCVGQKPMEDFERIRYAGVWNEHARTVADTDNMTCITNLFYLDEDKNDDTFSIVRLWVDESDNSQHIILKNGTLNIIGDGVAFTGHKFTIIDTDYDNWAIIFACDEAADRLLVWINTRATEPSIDTLDAISNVLDKYNIEEEDLSFGHANRSCPVDWTNAKVDEVDFQYENIKNELELHDFIEP